MLDARKIYDQLKNELFELDKDRKWYYNKVKPFKNLFWVPFLAGGIYFLWQIYFEQKDPPSYLIPVYSIWVFVSLITYLIINHLNLKKFKEQFNRQIAPKIVGGLGESFSYQYDGKILKQEVQSTLLFPSFGKYSCQDLVMGVIDDVPIRLAEIKMTKTITRSKERSSEKHIFSGFYFSAALKVVFPTKIWLTTFSNAEVVNKGVERVKLDHPALSKYFVYAEDEDLARKVLQPIVLDHIQAINTKLKKERIAFGLSSVSFNFSDQTVKMAVSTHHKLMEPKLSQSVNSLKFIKKQTLLLNALSSLVSDLTLG